MRYRNPKTENVGTDEKKKSMVNVVEEHGE